MTCSQWPVASRFRALVVAGRCIPVTVLLLCGLSRGDTNLVDVVQETGTNGVASHAVEDIWMDRANDAVFNAVEGRVDWFDDLFAQDRNENRRLRNSRFRTKLHVRVEERGGPEVSVEPDATADLYLPNLSRRLSLVVRSTDIDELPGVDPTKEDTSWLMGVARTVTRKRLWDVTWGIGAKLNPAPEPYATIRARRLFDSAPWYVTPDQKVFWSGDEGFGELTALGVEREIGPRTAVFSTSAERWTEETQGVEWEQSLLAAFYPDGYRRGRGNRQHSAGIRGTVFGHKSGSGVVDLYRAQVVWRYPLRRQWLYLDVVPGLDFASEDDWDETAWIRFGLEVYFGDSAGRGMATGPSIAMPKE